MKEWSLLIYFRNEVFQIITDSNLGPAEALGCLSTSLASEGQEESPVVVKLAHSSQHW